MRRTDSDLRPVDGYATIHLTTDQIRDALTYITARATDPADRARLVDMLGLGATDAA